MKNTVANMLRIQELRLDRGQLSAAEERELEERKRHVADSLLDEMESMFARDCRAIVPIIDHCCGTCKTRIPDDAIWSLHSGMTMQGCGKCGAILYLPEDLPK